MSHPFTPEGLSWISVTDLAGLGFVAGGPEHDFGHRWGPGGAIRVSFAPTGPGGHGFLYAYDRGLDRYAVLVESTTLEAVTEVWNTFARQVPTRDGHLRFAERLTGEAALTVEDAQALWRHCADAELAARRDYAATGADLQARLTAGRAVVIAAGARSAAESLLAHTLDPTACELGAPAIVRYRILDHPDWTGKVTGASVTDAAFLTTDLAHLAQRHGYQVQATSLSHGHLALSAARVPELSAVTTRAPSLFDATMAF